MRFLRALMPHLLSESLLEHSSIWKGSRESIWVTFNVIAHILPTKPLKVGEWWWPEAYRDELSNPMSIHCLQNSVDPKWPCTTRHILWVPNKIANSVNRVFLPLFVMLREGTRTSRVRLPVWIQMSEAWAHCKENLSLTGSSAHMLEKLAAWLSFLLECTVLLHTPYLLQIFGRPR